MSSQITIVTWCCFALLGLIPNSTFGSCVYAKALHVEELEIGNMLSWSTKMENESDKFRVQRSVDGLFFEDVGDLLAAGESNTLLNYRYLDIAIGKKRSFYKIIQIDLNGKEYHSPTVLMNRGQSNNMVVTGMSTTMTDKVFSLTLRSEEEIEAKYDFIGLEKGLIVSGTWMLAKGANLISFDLEPYPLGRYKLIIKNNEEIEKLIIEKVNKHLVPNIEYVVREH